METKLDQLRHIRDALANATYVADDLNKRFLSHLIGMAILEVGREIKEEEQRYTVEVERGASNRRAATG